MLQRIFTRLFGRRKPKGPEWIHGVGCTASDYERHVAEVRTWLRERKLPTQPRDYSALMLKAADVQLKAAELSAKRSKRI